jgi:hypothetical protein
MGDGIPVFFALASGDLHPWNLAAKPETPWHASEQ